MFQSQSPAQAESDEASKKMKIDGKRRHDDDQIDNESDDRRANSPSNNSRLVCGP